jgi:hypothetical protein
MTSLLEQAVNVTRNLPSHRQDEIAEMMLFFAKNDADLYELSAEDDAALALSLKSVESGEFATDDEVRAVWAKHGL